MFDIGWGELVLVGVVALIVIGPKELPGTLRTIGQAMTKLRRMAAEFQGQFNEAMREADLTDAQNTIAGISQGASFNPIQTIRDEIKGAVEGKPAEPPAPPLVSAPEAQPERDVWAAPEPAPAASQTGTPAAPAPAVTADSVKAAMARSKTAAQAAPQSLPAADGPVTAPKPSRPRARKARARAPSTVEGDGA